MNNFCHFHNLVLLIFCLSSTIHLCYCADAIIPGQPRYSNTTIASSEGSFALTYFTPGKSNKYYVGIRYMNLKHAHCLGGKQEHTNFRSILFTTQNFTRWKPYYHRQVQQRPTSRVLWQSFDHPTDSWLYGGKIGFNNVTNSSQILTSWRSEDDPAEGRYSLTIDLTSTGPGLALFNGSKVYWNDSFPYRSNILYATSINSNGNGSYFSTYLEIQQFFARLHVSGKMELWSDSSAVDTLPNCVTTKCGFYGICDDTSFPPTCKCPTGYKPRNSKEWASADFSAGCVRKTSADCLIWQGDLVFTAQTSSAAYYRLPKLEQDPGDPRKKVFFIAGGAIALLVFLLAFLHRYNRRNQLTTVPP